MKSLINVEMSQEELLLIIGSLIKSQVSRGIKEEKILDLVAKLSVQAIEKVNFEKLDEK